MNDIVLYVPGSLLVMLAIMSLIVTLIGAILGFVAISDGDSDYGHKVLSVFLIAECVIALGAILLR